MGRERPSGAYFDEPEFRSLDLATPPHTLPTADVFIHCAFDHIAGKYRGGEGDNPSRFIRRNYHGSSALFRAAKGSGIKHIIFLSSRAVFDGYDSGMTLTEDLTARPDNLYGEIKWMLEQELAAMPDMVTTVLRPTGVYGRPWRGAWHKWQPLFSDFEAGNPIAPRAGTEVHGGDVAQAVRLILDSNPVKVNGRTYNVSDIRLDRRDLLSAYAKAKGISKTLPPYDFGPIGNIMSCDSLKNLGWSPRGQQGLEAIFSK